MHFTYRYCQEPAITFIVVSFSLDIYIPVYVFCKHYASATCILHCCALFNNCYTWLPSHQLHLHKRRKKVAPRFPSTVLHHSLLALWQLSKWHFMDFMERISQTRNVTYFHCLHYTTSCLWKRRWRKQLIKSIEDLLLWIPSKFRWIWTDS